ncbi:MAG: RNA 2',3'-cyclic phosphodiesterase [Bacillota bacterium]
MEQLRLFWAVNLPPPLKRRLASLQEKLMSANADARWVEEENLHLTLQFLGNVEAQKTGLLIANMQSFLVGFSAFRLRLGGLGFFPNARRPRVFWAGIAGDLAALRRLHEHVQKANRLSGFPAEERDFRPHLTLARLRSNRGLNDLLAAVQELGAAVADLGELPVTSVDLMKSELSPRGPAYTLLGKVELS